MTPKRNKNTKIDDTGIRKNMQKYNNPAHRKENKIRRLTIPESDKNDAKIK